jgi:hypothetical protein
VFFVNVASKGFSHTVSLLFAALTVNAIGVAAKGSTRTMCLVKEKLSGMGTAALQKDFALLPVVILTLQVSNIKLYLGVSFRVAENSGVNDGIGVLSH